jgi:hypothetical protein
LEKDVTLHLAQRVARELGGDVRLTRDGDTNLSLGERVALARRSSARVFVSLHANAGRNDERGSETYVHPSANAASRDLAAAMQRCLASVGPSRAPASAQMAVLDPQRHETRTAACLVEVDYLSSPDGERRLTSGPEIHALSRAIATAIREHLSAARPTVEGLMSCTLSGPAGHPERPLPYAQSLQTDAEIMQAAFDESRRTLRLARSSLDQLRTGLRTSSNPRNDFERRVLISLGRWLHAPTSPANADRQRALQILDSAIDLIDRNLAKRTRAGGNPAMRRITGGVHAQTFDGDVERGIECGDTFFNVDGPNCRRDVITHERFHFVGVHHGGGASDAPTPRASITTPEQALDSADNLAQLVSEIMNGKTDACTRPHD